MAKQLWINRTEAWRAGEPPNNDLALLFLKRHRPEMHGGVNELVVVPGWVDEAGINTVQRPPGAVREKIQHEGWEVHGWKDIAGQVFEARNALLPQHATADKPSRPTPLTKNPALEALRWLWGVVPRYRDDYGDWQVCGEEIPEELCETIASLVGADDEENG